jgi:flagella synthesis protein FlgN
MSVNEASPGAQAMAAGLIVEHTAWLALLELLREEEHALVDGAADQLAALTSRKLDCLQSLSVRARVRLDALAAAGLSADASGMARWMADNSTPEARQHWQAINTLEEAARQANQRIGRLIEMRLGATRQALNVLIHAATWQAGLYDPSGQSVAMPLGKPLARV